MTYTDGSSTYEFNALSPAEIKVENSLLSYKIHLTPYDADLTCDIHSKPWGLGMRQPTQTTDEVFNGKEQDGGHLRRAWEPGD